MAYINYAKSVNKSTSELREVFLKQHMVSARRACALFIQPGPDALWPGRGGEGKGGEGHEVRQSRRMGNGDGGEEGAFNNV